MDDDTRLRGGHEVDNARPGEGVQGLVAALADGGREAACANTYAALDLGTNNCRLLIACPTGDSFRVVDSFSRIIRLGEGISATRSEEHTSELQSHHPISYAVFCL